MNDGIARIFDVVEQRTPRGTAFAISPELGLTAFHCIGKRNNGEITTPWMRLLFLGGASVEAEYLDGDPQADFAVLHFLSQLPAGLRTIPLTLDVMAHVPFRCTGYPTQIMVPDISSSHGTVVAPDSSLFQVAAIQLFSYESAAELCLDGMSGAPVLVGTPEAAVGIIRWNPKREPGSKLAVGGIVYACPIKSAIKRQPSLNRYVIETQLTISSYLKWVQERCGKIELRGIERGGLKVLQLDLDQAYVPLKATIAVSPEEHDSSPDELLIRPGTSTGPVDLDQVLRLGNRLVITGGSGSGKTTVLLYMAWVLATAILEENSRLALERLGLDGPLPLPIYIPLAAYAEHLRALKQSTTPSDPREHRLSSFITRYLIRKDADFDLPEDFFVRLLLNSQAVALLLDGFDEVSNEDERKVVRQAIEELVTTREGMLRVIVTCRTAAYKGHTALGSDFREVVVKELDSGHIRNMVHKFYQCIHPKESSKAEAETNQLMGKIELLESQRRHSQAATAPLINSPLMVRLLLIVRYNERQMPEERAELFKLASETMLQLDYVPEVQVQQSLKTSVGKSWSDHYQMLQDLAFSMHRQGEAHGRELDEAGLRETFRYTYYKSYVDALINYTQTRGGLLEERLGTYHFIHLGFQEYLAARHLIKVVGGKGGLEAIVSFLEQGPIRMALT